MPIINTAEMDIKSFNAEQVHWIYNGLDCCVTRELLPTMQKILTPEARQVYELEKALQAPVLEMMRRGLLVDDKKRTAWIADYRAKQNKVNQIIQRYADAVWDAPLNPGSYKQLQDFFYKTMRLPVQYKYSKQTGKRIMNTDVDALSVLKQHFYAKPIILAIEKYRELGKLISTLEQGVDKDGIFRASFNIAGTDTGRFSSSKNAFGTGSNLQNITNLLREIFIARKGKKYAYIDLEQAESNIVAHKAGDENYIKAHMTGDPHTVVARMIWPDLPWTGDIKKDRAMCDDQANPFYRHYTHRDMSKRGQHGTNYYGMAKTMAKHLKVPVRLIEEFQEAYFSPENFPGIREWHRWTAEQLQTTGQLTTAFKRMRTFFGRLHDDSTLRKAIAYDPQSTVGDYLNTGLLNIWREYTFTDNLPTTTLLVQLHDAVLIEYDADKENIILPRIQNLMEFTIPVEDITGITRPVVIKTDVVVGWNWAYATVDNPDGLKKWRGNDDRQRIEIPKIR